MKKSFIMFALLAFVPTFCGCANQNPAEPILENYTIEHEEEFGGAYIHISIEDFNKLGFKFGDSLNLYFSNNVTYTDIGYYSGYYVPAGQELVVGYHGYPYVKFAINYGDDPYILNNFDENTTVTIKVNEAGKYLDVEQNLALSYSDNVSDYESKEEFANFREVTVGDIKEGLIYRGASPIDNKRNRAAVVDDLIQATQIAYDVDLADKDETVEDFYDDTDFDSPYFKNLDDKDDALLLGMSASYKTDEYDAKMKTLFLAMLENDGPYYIHCLEGKDRTGFVCMVIESLCGATYEEILDDYFITYHNYYDIEKGTLKYELVRKIHIDAMITYVYGFNETTNLATVNYQNSANSYLLHIGLTQEQINAVHTKLTN